MKDFIMFLATIILFSIIVLGIYKLLYKFVLKKIKINKWVLLAIAAVEFIAPPLLFKNMPLIVSNYVIPGIFIILILWFADLIGFMKRFEPKEEPKYYQYNGKKKKDDIVIKPKAKPNRVKNK